MCVICRPFREGRPPYTSLYIRTGCCPARHLPIPLWISKVRGSDLSRSHVKVIRYPSPPPLCHPHMNRSRQGNLGSIDLTEIFPWIPQSRGDLSFGGVILSRVGGGGRLSWYRRRGYQRRWPRVGRPPGETRSSLTRLGTQGRGTGKLPYNSGSPPAGPATCSPARRRTLPWTRPSHVPSHGSPGGTVRCEHARFNNIQRWASGDAKDTCTWAQLVATEAEIDALVGRPVFALKLSVYKWTRLFLG